MERTERRRFPRHEVIHHSPLHDARDGRLVGRVADVSDEGLSFLAEAGFAAGTVLDLILVLPFPVDGRTRLTFRGEVRWCRADLDPEMRRTGLQVLDPSEEQIRIFHQLHAQECFLG